MNFRKKNRTYTIFPAKFLLFFLTRTRARVIFDALSRQQTEIDAKARKISFSQSSGCKKCLAQI